MPTPSVKNSNFAAVLPSLTDVMFLMPLVFMLVWPGGAADMLEGDTGWHIRAGDWMLAHGQVARTDMFSFTKPGEAWYAWEWLWDIGAALLHRQFGMAAVVFGSMFLLCLTSALLFRFVLRACGGYRLPAAALTFLALASSTIHWLARPHMFTWLFVVVTLWIITWHESGERHWLWMLPVLTLPWVNIHGGFMSVFLLLAAYGGGHLLGAAIDALNGRGAERARRAVPYFATGVGCAVASLVNPYGFGLYRHIYEFFSQRSTVLFTQISEWQSTNFQHPSAQFVEWLVLAAAMASVHHWRRGQYQQVLLMMGWVHLALQTVRHMPLFAIVAVAPVGQALVEGVAPLFERGSARVQQAWRAFLDLEHDFGGIDGLPRLHLVSMLAMVLVLRAGMSPAAPKKLSATFPVDRYPVKAIDTMAEPLLAQGRVFTVDEWGDYLIYRLAPQTKVFIDGRFDFYGVRHTEDYLKILAGRYDWEQRLTRHGIDRVLLPVDHSLATTMKESARWKAVYDDGVSVFFQQQISATASLSTPPVQRAQLNRIE